MATNTSPPVPWYHQPLWSGVLGGVATAAVIGFAGFTSSGGLVSAMGGITQDNLYRALLDLKSDRPDGWKQLIPPGETPTVEEVITSLLAEHREELTGPPGEIGPQGEPGASAPSVEEVITSLLAEHREELTGPPGEIGPQGEPGAPGASVKDIVTELRANPLEELRGPQGPTGSDGTDATIPSDLVVASTIKCSELGEGWRRYTLADNKFIMGTADASQVEKYGGSKEPSISLPAHSHALQIYDGAPPGTVVGWGKSTKEKSVIVYTLKAINNQARYNLMKSSEEGVSNPKIEINPPYVALYWCQKS
jgi:hypothetical protein